MSRNMWKRFRSFGWAMFTVLALYLYGANLWGTNSLALGWSPAQNITEVVPVAQAQPTVESFMQQGKNYYDNEQFLPATQALQSAVEIFVRDGDRLRQSQALGLQALAWLKLSNPDRAQANLKDSLSILDTLTSTHPEVNRVRAQLLNTQGQILLMLGQTQPALESWIAAEAQYRQAQSDSGVLGAQINQVQALQSLGMYRRAEKLLDQLEVSLLAEPSPLESTLRVKGLLNFGNILQLGGQVQRAQIILKKGLTIATEAQLARDEGQALLALGNVERVLGKRAEAIQDQAATVQHLQTAMKYYQDAQTLLPTGITPVISELNQMSLLIDTGKYSQALAMRSHLLERLPKLPASRTSIYARINLARQSIDITPLEEAPVIAKNLATAIKQARTLEDSRAEAYGLLALGHLYETHHNLSNAQQVTHDALTIAQAIQASEIVYQCQWQMGRLGHAALSESNSNEASIQTDVIHYYTDAVNTLNELRSDLVVLNPDIQFSFRDTVEPVYRELVDLLLSKETPTVQNLKQAQEVIEALQLAEIDNFFRDTCAKPKPVDIDTFDPNAAVVYPILLNDRLAVILKLPGTDNLRYYSTREVSAHQMDAEVSQFLRKLARQSSPPGDLKHEAQQLYRWLLEPFALDLEQSIDRSQSQIKTLVFVLDGALRNVPMSTLYDGKNYLIERYAIAVAPSLQLLEPQTLQQEKLRVLLAGATDAPSFAKAGLAPLDNVAIEMASISEQINQSTILEDQKFQKSTIRNQLKSSDFNIVHLATHGNFSSNLEQTFLLTWDDRLSITDIDTLFQVSDLKQKRPIELLVLSACETAAGDNRAALGLAGVAIRSDVRSTLATLWNVDDASTAEFMIQFYQQLSRGSLTKAEALRNVQLNFLKNYSDTDYNRPFHWSPFTLVGNWL